MKLKRTIISVLFLLLSQSKLSTAGESTIRIVFSNGDQRVGTLIGLDSTYLYNLVLNDENIVIQRIVILSPEAFNYLTNYFYKYPIDSTIYNRRSMNTIQFVLNHQQRDLDFIIEYNMFNDYLMRFILYIQMSYYKEECAALMNILWRYHQFYKK